MSLNRTLIDVIIRQTDYTEEKAIDKLIAPLFPVSWQTLTTK